MSEPQRRVRPLRVGLLGAFGSGNLGNDASLQAMIALVRGLAPDAELVCYCPVPEIIRDRFGVTAEAIRVRRPSGRRGGRLARLPYRVGDMSRAYRSVGKLDVLAVPGTGILDDFGGERASGWPLTLAVWFAAARARGTKTALVGIGAGPLRSRVSRRLARFVGRMATYRSFRDTGSWNFMLNTGLAVSSHEVVPDVVLSLPEPNCRRQSTEARVIAVPVMHYDGWDKRSQSKGLGQLVAGVLAEFCEWLLDEGYAVRLINAGRKDHLTTTLVAREVREKRPELAEAWLTVGTAETYAELCELLNDATAVVATRYHSVVCALMCAKPTISLGYAAKNDELMTAVGLGEFCQRIEHIDQARLRQQFTMLIANRERYTKEVAQRVDELRAHFYNERERIRDLLLSG